MPELVHPGQLDPRLTDLQRPRHTGFTGGLCRASAERWGVDPLIVRLAVVALAFAGGAGVVVYVWGCLLTPRVGEHPPILRWVPAFGRWPLRTQGVVVAGSFLVVTLSLARQTGVAWGPVIIVAAVAWAMTRRRRDTEETGDGSPATDHEPDPGTPRTAATADAVEQWRARVGAHRDAALPAVDLYAPEAPSPAAPAAVSSGSRTSWWAALVVTALAATGAAVPLVLGVQPALLWALVGASGTGAVLLIAWSIVARRRRLPTGLLVLALAVGAATGALGVAHSRATTVPLAQSGGAAHYTFVGEAPADLDLTGLPMDTAATVTIDATASVVRVHVAAPPESVTLQSDTTYVEPPPQRNPVDHSELNLVIDGDLSVVVLEVDQ